MNKTINRILRGAGFAFSILLSVSANAVPIQFIFTGTGSGTLDGTAFSGASFTLTQFGDTDNIHGCDGAGDCSVIGADSAQVTIAGLGTFNFTSSSETFFNRDVGVVGFTYRSPSIFPGIVGVGADLYNLSMAPPYDLVSSIGPISTTGTLLQWAFQDVYTDGGVLVFNDAPDTQATFQAIVGAVPEPETWGMLLAGLGVIGTAVRRRRVLNCGNK